MQEYINSYFPEPQMLVRNFTREWPVVSSCHSYSVTGGGNDYGNKHLISAFGEYYERAHFFLDTHYDKENYLHNVLKTEECQAIYNCIDEIKKTDEDPRENKFFLSKVINILNGEKSYLPAEFIFLGPLEDKKNLAFIPHIDSCGCAAHKTAKEAYISSRDEFIERQSLLASWLSGTVKQIYNNKVLDQVNGFPQELIKRFLSNGEIFILDLQKNINAHAIAILYFAKCSDDKVQYAIGASGGLDFSTVISGAIMELCQDYAFLHDFSDTDKISNYLGSSYNFNHFNDNRRDIKKEIPFVLEEGRSYPEIKTYDEKDFLESLKKISSHIYSYQRYDTNGLYYHKFISPDFFIHMNPGSHLNFNCAYSKTLGLDKKRCNIKRLPFP